MKSVMNKRKKWTTPNSQEVYDSSTHKVAWQALPYGYKTDEESK